MIFQKTDGIELGFFPEWIDEPNIFHAFSTRNGGVSEGNFSTLNLGYSTTDSNQNVDENRRRFFEALSLAPDQTAMALQVHGTHVAVVDAPGITEECDGLLTQNRDLCLIIGVADCHTIFITDTKRSFVGALHSGWRGTAGNILRTAVEKARTHFGTVAPDLEIGISPAIGGCCYEIGHEVAEQFSEEFVDRRSGKLYLSLDQVIAKQAADLGVPLDQIYTAQQCTFCEQDKWFSYRRDNGNTGRMWGVIGRQ